MSDKPRRKFWQFHLSTAVSFVLMVGGLLYANFGPHFSNPILVGSYTDPGDYSFFRYRLIGWPLFWRGEFEELPKPSDITSISDGNLPAAYRFPDGRRVKYDRDMPLASEQNFAMAVNAATAVFILIVTVVSAEYIARRREGRKP